jgi:hypothetical protein
MQLTDFQKGEIVALRDSMSHREIGRELDIPHRTVSSFLERYDQRKSADNLPHPGAPRKLSTADIRYLVRTVESETRVPLAEIPVNTTFSNVSIRTIRRRLREEGIRKWKAVGRALLTKKHAAQRLKWALEHRNWTREDWKKIIWSDECLVRLDSDPRQVWVFLRQNKHEKYAPKNIRGKVKYGGVSQMIWGCFMGDKLGPVVFINGMVNAEVYINVLADSLLPFIDTLNANDPSNIVFQQDNARPHKAKKTITLLDNWAKEHGFSRMESGLATSRAGPSLGSAR